MPAPLIGITTYGRNEAGRFCLPGAYVDAVRRARGVPVLLPPNEPDLERLLDCLDGIIFSGGGDIHPARYGGETHPEMYMVDSERDAFELSLAQMILASTDLPVLGICRGSQILNVASGGTLVPHLSEQGDVRVRHREAQLTPAEHPVRIEPDSRLARILGRTDITVKSWHHQAVRRVAPGWRVVAWAADGVAEALEHTDHGWAFAVQWHPELSPEDPGQQKIFQALVQAGRVRSRGIAQPPGGGWHNRSGNEEEQPDATGK